VYPDLQKTPEAREYFNNMAFSSYPGPNATNSSSYQGGSYHGGQGVSSSYPYAANSPIAAPRGASPAPRANQFMLKVRLRLMN